MVSPLTRKNLIDMADARTHDSYGREILRDENGKDYVQLQGTKRPDGSLRAGKKVKPDYMPQDEMASYGAQVRGIESWVHTHILPPLF
jgi:hypothetical protein